MHGFVSYRRFGRARSLRNDQAVCVLGRYVATELWLELARYVTTKPCASSVATKRRDPGRCHGRLTRVVQPASAPPPASGEAAARLGLEKYEKNFKKRHFTDPTLPLLTDRELQEVNIPGGARLLILDHIKRYHKMENRK
ncbi:hypothetical protein F2Q68_00036237 [Brassica cretica]|uniref:SAM domain-containing protein n=1 Tax=Brassica cretica TaxID=69181 RepID=A0A8S9HB97_BRACR|nr:hypothetical protein F2Q68_00036237 [Brassica cretica]